MTDSPLQERFKALALKILQESAAALTWSQELIGRYSETRRHYHTTCHIAAMLACLDTHREFINDALAVELAIFFHDWIYNPQSKTNELDSIVEFIKFAKDLALNENIQQKVVVMIEATIKHQVPENTPRNDKLDLQLFLDFDLEVLGRDWVDYKIYAKQIRKEYACYDDEAYQSGRLKVMRSFLDRERIYFSEIYYADKERTARQNITREIELLETSGVLE